jgi:hypothetical protein
LTKIIILINSLKENLNRILLKQINNESKFI